MKFQRRGTASQDVDSVNTIKKCIKEYKPYGNVVMSDEPQSVFLLTEMVDQQRKPDDQGCGSNDHSQGNQGQVLLTAGKNKPE